jgi:protein SCO1/2
MRERRSVKRTLAIATSLLAIAGLAVFACVAAAKNAVPAPLPGNSVYHLPMHLTLQDGSSTSLVALRGQPVLITMFYSSCEGVCPLLAFAMRRVVAAVPDVKRNRLRMLMVSFDPERDTPEKLAEFARLHNIDDPHWLLARASPDEVRDLAAVLGIRYRALENGVFSHSAVITLLDADGVIRAHTAELQALDSDFMQRLDESLQ